MFERFTELARKVLAQAGREAQRLDHQYVGTEHLLLGLVKERSCVAAHVLKSFGVDLREARDEVARTVSDAGAVAVADSDGMPQTPEARKAVQLALAEARALHHNRVATEHLLLGLLAQRDCKAGHVLTYMGLDLDDIRAETLRLIGADGKEQGSVAALGKARMKQFVVTPAMGKRLIAKAVAAHPAVTAALEKGTVVIVAGTTNACVAEEILASLGLGGEFSAKGFRRGTVVPPGFDASSVKADFPGDVVLVDGEWLKGKQIFDVIDDMQAGDVIIKGANALDPVRKRAALLIGDPSSGTGGALLPAVSGRRIKLIVPVGLEKRVFEDIADLAEVLNSAEAEGPRMLCIGGEVVTELDAIGALTGASARLLAAGGVYGAEGAVWLGVRGDADQIAAAGALIGAAASDGVYCP